MFKQEYITKETDPSDMMHWKYCPPLRRNFFLFFSFHVKGLHDWGWSGIGCGVSVIYGVGFCA
jgi:hypothetical protein